MFLYRTDRDGNLYRTEQDDMVEVLTEEQQKSQLSSYSDYIDKFVRDSQTTKFLTVTGTSKDIFSCDCYSILVFIFSQRVR